MLLYLLGDNSLIFSRSNILLFTFNFPSNLDFVFTSQMSYFGIMLGTRRFFI